jgi:hypothetical protein
MRALLINGAPMVLQVFANIIKKLRINNKQQKCIFSAILDPSVIDIFCEC